MRSREELKILMYRFMKDERRGITLSAFAKLCGVTPEHLSGVFMTGKFPLTSGLQTRANNAFDLWASGRVRVESRGGSYHNIRVRVVAEEKPALRKIMKIDLSHGHARLVTGIRKRADYGV